MARLMSLVGSRRARRPVARALAGAGLLLVLVPGLGRPASGDTNPSPPVNQTLEVSPEISTAVTGDPNVSLTARLYPQTPPPNDTVISFEVENGPIDHDGDTPETPDYSCTIFATVNSANDPPQCTVPLEPALVPGTSLIRAWIDSNLNASVVEADLSEGRLSSRATDCPPGTNDRSVADGTCQQGTEQPGAVAEPDNTDVVQVNFVPRPDLLDCAPQQATDVSDTVIVLPSAGVPFSCTVTNTAGSPVPNPVVDGENGSDADNGRYTNVDANHP